MLTPISRKACKVASASSPSKKPVTCVVPSAIAPNMIERCDTDLSPGTLNLPWKLFLPGNMVNCCVVTLLFSMKGF